MSSRLLRVFALGLLGSAAALGSGCSSNSGASASSSDPDSLGALGLALQVAPGTTLSSVSYAITGPGGFARAGSIDTSHSTLVKTVIGNLPVGSGFSITLDATADGGVARCAGTATFEVAARSTTSVTVHLTCHESPRTGSVDVKGSLNVCPVVDGISASPGEVLVGSSLQLAVAAHDSDAGPAAMSYQWTTTGGTLSAAGVQQPTLTCTTPGDVTVSVSVTDGDCADTLSTTVTCSGAARVGVDLSRYTRVGRYDLPEPTRTTPPNATSLLAQEASSVTYDWDTDSLFVVGDGGTSVVQVSKTGVLLNSMTLAPGSSPQGTEFYDTEGISYVGGGKFLLVEERYRQANLFSYVAGGTLTRADVKTVKLGTTIGNIGLEGGTYDPASGNFIFVKEKDPKGIFETSIDFAAGTASNGSPSAVESSNLFEPSLLPTLDFSDVFALSNLPALSGDPTYDQLLVISQESGQIVQVDRAGHVQHTLAIVADAGDTLSVPDMTMEGLTMDRDGMLYVVNEDGGGDANHPQLWVYAPSTATNQAPTGVSLRGAATSIPENTNTASAVKLADVFVTDDGLGDNALSVSGPDAASFEVVGTALFLKAGTALNAVTQASYHVSIDVDDGSVGASPDASTSYTLTIDADVSGDSNLAITEVAPWSSGNSPLASDWFEVTNFGTAAAGLVGWTMDDNSNSFAVSVALNGISSIGPGESVIFIETANASELPGKAQAFIDLWFGGVAPAGLQIGSYSGSGVGLSTGGDAVNLFDNAGTVRAAISFGPAPSGTPLPTFDNATGLNEAAISTLSSVGQYGAFVAANDATELGSPGTIGAGAAPIVGIVAVDNLAAETASDPGVLRFSRSGSTASPLTVIYAIASGAGQASSSDYTPTLTGSQLIPAGAAFVDLTITPVDDAVAEGTEQLTLTLSDTGSYDVGADASATITIQDNDAANQTPSAGSIVISEVAPWSSSNSPLAQDWFEVTNTGSTSVDLTGWKMDDNSHAFANAVALSGIDTIAPGEAVIFIESADLATSAAAFRSLWGGAGPTLRIGSYSGSGVGLSGNGDEVTLFDSAGNLVTGVGFGAAPAAAPFATFDNHAGVGGTALPLPVINALSALGVNGAFVAPGDASELGSPGVGSVGRLIISEIAPWASSNSPYLADWFEVTNVGSAAVDVSGWTMDDNSNDVTKSVPLVGVASIAPGQSIVLIEGDGSAASAFLSAWFGGTAPAGLVIGSYTGSGVGLSSSGDAVNLFNASGHLVTGVQFGAASVGFTFDNAAGLASAATLSVAGSNGAFLATDGIETGSPGKVR